MTPHNFDEEHHVVTTGGIAKLINRFHAGLSRRLETDRVIGTEQIVVNRSRQSDDLSFPVRT